MKTNPTLHQLYLNELRDLYNAETQILRSLPRMVSGVSNPELSKAFDQHLEATKHHVERLRAIFEAHNENPQGTHCDGMQGLLTEGAKILREYAAGPVLDTALVAAIQKVEHYEICGYATVHALAKTLHLADDAASFETTLKEEIHADELLKTLGTACRKAAAELESHAGEKIAEKPVAEVT